MLRIDKTDLISFFGVLPKEQEDSEQAFFGTTIFEVCDGMTQLSISFSSHFNDCVIYLKHINTDEPILDLHFQDILAVKMRQDKPEIQPTLQIFEGADERFPSIEISMSPIIRIRVRNHI